MQIISKVNIKKLIHASVLQSDVELVAIVGEDNLSMIAEAIEEGKTQTQIIEFTSGGKKSPVASLLMEMILAAKFSHECINIYITLSKNTPGRKPTVDQVKDEVQKQVPKSERPKNFIALLENTLNLVNKTVELLDPSVDSNTQETISDEDAQ